MKLFSRFHVTFITALALACLAVGASPAPAQLTVTGLECEHLKNPLGIAATKPRLSWYSESKERAQEQSAYQILVASTQEKLDADEGDLWDSGKVKSDKSLFIRYAGKPLESCDECFWKVRLWDQADVPSPWSKSALWSMGLLNPSDWRGKWIGREEFPDIEFLTDTNWIWFPDGKPAEAVAPGEKYFRRTFEIPADRAIKSAIFRITADDRCSIFLNGADIGSRSGHRSAKEMDLTKRLQSGRNVLAVSAKNEGENANPAGLVAWLRVEFTDGEPLLLVTDANWKAWDKLVDGWSATEFNDADWPAALVVGPVGMQPWGEVRHAEDRRLPARYLRKEFLIETPVRRATVSMSGLGVSELYINGQRIGDAVLSPAMAEYPKRTFYVTHDVTKALQDGANAIGVILGNGRYYSPRSDVYAGMTNFGYPKLLLQLRLEHTDGTITEVVSDNSWRITSDGPIIANNEYDGEEYDASKEMTGWNEPAFDDSRFLAAENAVAPLGELVPEPIDPIRVTETLKPIAITEPRPGVFIFDMGQNMVGWCRLKVSGPAGTAVKLRHAETLQPDGELYLANIRGARVTDIYTLKGEGTEVWEPRFTYHGFRFVEVTGFPGKPTLDSLEGRVVHDDVQRIGEFECSNPLLNQIFKNVVWGTRGNYRSVPTDCPQRDERQGWLGDRSEESRGEMYIYDNNAFYAKWLQDIADSQKPSGSVPDVSPAHWPIYSDNVTWPSSTVIVPNSLFRQFGDKQIIADHYDSAKRWIDYMLTFAKDGILDRDQYGDWCVPPEDPKLIHSKDPARATDKSLLATSYFCYDLALMERYAQMLGKTEDADRFQDLAEDMKAAFNKKFLNREKGHYDNGSQTSSVLPLYFDLVPDDMRERVFEHLVNKITVETKGHIGTGLIGGQFLNRVLADNGRSDIAYTIASQKDYPSWGYMISQGATTIWELWNGITADPAMNSGNHVMLVGDLVIWLFEDLAGIKPDEEQPAFKHIVMYPQPVGDLTYVEASLLSPYGMIRSHWEKKGDSFTWQISVPANATATIYVPAKDADAVKEGSVSAKESEGVEFVRMEDDRTVFNIGSGDYRFESP
jgi:alpha-L-rhamnosidase